MNARRLICRSLVVWVAVQSAAWAQFSFQGIGFIPGSDYPPNTFPRGVSADGLVVVGKGSSETGINAFRWTEAAGAVILGSIPGGGGNIGESISADGSVIVGRGSSPESGSNLEAFRWTAEEGMVGLGDLPGGLFNSNAHSVSGDGSVIVGFSTADPGPEAFRWTAETGMVPLGESCAESDFEAGSARGISADGLVIVGTGVECEGAEGQAFRWTAEDGMVGLGDLPGGTFGSQARGVSADGSVVVGRGNSASGSEAFRWTADEGMIGLGDLPGGVFDSWAFGVSADGSIVVGLSCVAGGPLFCSGLDAFIWDAAHGMRNLHDVLEVGYGFDLGGWDLTSARGVSADGLVIVGSGGNPDGLVEGWILRLPDCNGNGIADDLDILDGTAIDNNGNYIPDECEEDCNGNGQDDLDDIADGTSEDCNDNDIPDECEPDCNGNDQQDDCDIEQGVSEDCDGNTIPDECDADCNDNGQPDACDIEDGTSLDCDGSGVPDECELDCNGNGQSDDCDIEQGLSEDCNFNAVPDECEETVPIIEQPEDQQVEEGDFAWFYVEADGFLLEYQWRKDGVDLVDTDRIIGSTSAFLLIFEVQPSDAGEYDCVITGFFGCTSISDAATLTVTTDCPADFDDDGVVGPFDLAVLLGFWGPNPDHPADLDNDDIIGPADLALLLGAWGPCQ